MRKTIMDCIQMENIPADMKAYGAKSCFANRFSLSLPCEVQGDYKCSVDNMHAYIRASRSLRFVKKNLSSSVPCGI